MDQERLKVIVKEIEYWQRSKLLPDQYCDFLLNLYMESNEEREPVSIAGKTVKAIKTASWKHWFLTFGFFSLICFIVLYFNAFHPLLQIGLTASSVFALLFYGHFYRRKNEAAGLALIGMGMLLMLGGGLYMLRLHDLEGWGWQAGLLLGCALFWVAFGIGARIPILHLCGWMASFLVYSLLLSNKTSVPAWYEVQLYWLPASFVFGWSSWFSHRWSRPVAAVLFISGALIWFMPELYTALFLAEQPWLQVQLLVKISMGGLLLFSLRKKWIAWVA